MSGIPDPAHIGPIRDMNMKSSNMKVIEKMRQKEEKKSSMIPLMLTRIKFLYLSQIIYRYYLAYQLKILNQERIREGNS